MLDSVLLNTAHSISEHIVRNATKHLGEKYSVDIIDVQHIISNTIQDQFQACISIAIKSFSISLTKDQKLTRESPEIILSYLKSPIVSEEIWHLLEPGSEYFDRGKLVDFGFQMLSENLKDLEPQTVFNAWEEFLKAFSFASRSTPEFREFLRASYEAGSFKALSNIEDVLEKMGAAIGAISSEELIARQSLTDYMAELKLYRDWAVSF